MEAPEVIFVPLIENANGEEWIYDVGLNEELDIAKNNIKYIRAELVELTADDMRLAFGCVNEAIDNCNGKTKQEIFEDALRRFNLNRRK